MPMKKKILEPENMTPDQKECYELLCDLWNGEHHLPGDIYEFGNGIAINSFHSMSTYDFSDLTKFVVLCHDRCVRGEIFPLAPRYLRIALHKRHTRDGSIFEKHPTLEKMTELLRGAK